jgi:hypothetical protein
MNLPSIGVVFHLLSTTGHLRDEAMSPQGDLAHSLSTFHTQHPQNLGSNPTTVPILHLSLFSTTCTTQGIYPLHYSQPLKLYHLFIRDPSVLDWPKTLSWRPSRTLSYPRSSLGGLYQALESLPQQENVLEAYKPCYRHTSIISIITHNLEMVSFKYNMVGALSNTPLSYCYLKSAYKNCLSSLLQFPLLLSCLTHTLLKDNYTSSHSLQ